jgi:hypothetical protein
MKTTTKSSVIINRRKVLKTMAALPFIGSMAFAGDDKHGTGSFEERNLIAAGTSGTTLRPPDNGALDQLKGKVPHARIKGTDISRMIMGGNLFVDGLAGSVCSELVTYLTDQSFRLFRWLRNVASTPDNQSFFAQFCRDTGPWRKIRFISDSGFNPQLIFRNRLMPGLLPAMYMEVAIILSRPGAG